MHDSDERGESRPAREARVLEAGARFGDYRVVQRIGAGGMGEVYRARDETLDRDVALKLLPASLTSDESRRTKFEAEARAMASVAHPNVVALYGVGNEEGVPYVVTELLLGRTVHAEIREGGAMPPSRVVAIAIQIARALAAVHERGVIHCDLKPSNIFLIDDDHVKILDFGLARLLTPSWQPPEDDADTPSFPAEIFGSPGFMSPEQVEGRAVDYRADIFSFGAVLYEMLYGEPAFKGPTQVETMYAVLRRRPPRIGTEPSGGSALERIIERCLEKRPESRFQSAKDLLFALKHLTRPEGAAVSSEPLMTKRPPRTSRKLAAGAVAAILVGVSAVSIVRGTFSSPSPPEPPRMQLLTTHGQALFAAISPDGRYFAHSSQPSPGIFELRLRDIEQETELLLAGPTREILGQVIFAPDQSGIYFGSRPMQTGPSPKTMPLEIHRVPFIGGAPKTLAAGVWLGTMALSPNGRQMIFTCGCCDGCFGKAVRMVPTSGSGTAEDVFTYEGYVGRCIWSDDGKSLECHGATRRVDGELRGRETLRFDLATKELTALPQVGGYFAAPVRSANGMVVAGKMDPADRHDQLWWVPRGGAPIRLHEDLLDYSDVSISDGGDVVAVATKQTSNLFRIPAGSDRAIRLTSGHESLDGAEGIAACAGGAIYFASEAAGNAPAIWRLDALTGARRRVTDWPHAEYNPACSPDGRTIYFNRQNPGDAGVSIWKMDADGSNATEIASDGSFIGPKAVSPDGRWLVYPRFSGKAGVWKLSVDGGTDSLFVPDGRSASWSPDGRMLLVEHSEAQWSRIVDAETGADIRELPVRGSATWSHDGNAIVAKAKLGDDAVESLWRFPIEGGEPSRVSAFDASGVIRLDVSPEGDVVIASGDESRDVILFRDLLKRELEKNR